jgi:hypothetical protein
MVRVTPYIDCFVVTMVMFSFQQKLSVPGSLLLYPKNDDDDSP